MGKFTDLTGQKFGRLTVIERAENIPSGKTWWLCQCKCGNQTIVRSDSLKGGVTKSCGCLHKELSFERCKQRMKHGHSMVNIVSKTYSIWRNIIQRCNNPNCRNYKNYGGRGIKVCDKWLKFEDFLQDMGEKPEGLSLDRVDNNGNYCKGNCRWATWKEQQRNSRNNRLITINGETKCLAEWCEIYKKPYQTVYNRINRYKWTPEEALELIPRKKHK